MITLEMLDKMVKASLEAFPTNTEVRLAITDDRGCLVGFCDQLQFSSLNGIIYITNDCIAFENMRNSHRMSIDQN